MSPFYKATCYAIRDAETKERLSQRYFDKKDLPVLSRYKHTGRIVEIYKSTMDRPIACHPKNYRNRPCVN